MNWAKTVVFCRARMGEVTDPDQHVVILGERILHMLEVGLSNRMYIIDPFGGPPRPSPFGDGALETAKNLTLELALLWHEHSDFPQCWSHDE